MENAILPAQKSDIMEHFVYQKLSQSAMDSHNKSVLKQISDDDLKAGDPKGRLRFFKRCESLARRAFVLCRQL